MVKTLSFSYKRFSFCTYRNRLKATLFFFLAPYSEYKVTVNAQTKAGDGVAVVRLGRTNQSSNLILIEALNFHNYL